MGWLNALLPPSPWEHAQESPLSREIIRGRAVGRAHLSAFPRLLLPAHRRATTQLSCVLKSALHLISATKAGARPTGESHPRNHLTPKLRRPSGHTFMRNAFTVYRIKLITDHRGDSALFVQRGLFNATRGTARWTLIARIGRMIVFPLPLSLSFRSFSLSVGNAFQNSRAEWSERWVGNMEQNSIARYLSLRDISSERASERRIPGQHKRPACHWFERGNYTGSCSVAAVPLSREYGDGSSSRARRELIASCACGVKWRNDRRTHASRNRIYHQAPFSRAMMNAACCDSCTSQFRTRTCVHMRCAHASRDSRDLGTIRAR